MARESYSDDLHVLLLISRGVRRAFYLLCFSSEGAFSHTDYRTAWLSGSSEAGGMARRVILGENVIHATRMSTALQNFLDATMLKCYYAFEWSKFS